MKSKDIFNRIEEIIDAEVNQPESISLENSTENTEKTNRFKEIGYLSLQIVVNILKAPFKIVAKYLRDEIILAVKKDAKIFSLIMGIMGVLFVFFSVMWLFISVAVGVYFYDNEHTILTSIILSITFQIISFILIALIAVFASQKLKTLKVLSKLNDASK
jgi:hypothetical protein